MSALEDISRRMRVANLEARLELQEIERATLKRTIESPLTAAADREEAQQRHEDSMDYSARLKEELNALCPPRSSLIH